MIKSCVSLSLFTIVRDYLKLLFIIFERKAQANYAELGDEELEKINPVFRMWESQDQLLISWLLSSMTDRILPRMVSCVTSKQIGKTLEIYFAQQI